MALDMVKRHRVIFGLLLLFEVGLYLADLLSVVPDTTLPAVYYAVPVVIAAWLLPPGLVAGVAAWAWILEFTANWIHQPPMWLFAMYMLSITLFGVLATTLAARSAREAALTAQAEANQAEAERQRDRARASEELLRAVVDNSPAYIYLKDPAGRYLMLNRLFESSFHKPIADMLGKTDFEVHATAEQARALREDDRRVVEAGMPLEFEEVAQRDDGPHHYLSAKFPVRDAKGAVYAIGGVSTDITERKRAEEALRESEDRFRRAVLEAPLPIMIHAEDGEVMQISRAWTEITGYSHADIPTTAAWAERAYGQRMEVVKEAIDRLYELDRSLSEGEFVVNTADGHPRIWDFSSAPLGRLSDGRRLVISMAMDVTERKRAEEERERLLASIRDANEHLVIASTDEQSAAETAERQAEQMKTLVASLGEAVIIVDSERRIVLRNRASRELSGISDEQMQHDLDERHVTYLTLDGQTTSFEDTPISRTLRGEQFIDHEGILVRPDGSRRRVLMSGAGVRDESGQVVMGLVVYRDVTELRDLERTREEYLRAITHDVRNPLTSVLGVAQLIERYADRPELVRKNSKLLAESARRVNRMLNELVESIQIESGRLRVHPRPVDLPSLVFSLRDQMLGVGEDRVKRVRVECPDALPPVMADPESLERIVTNLISNALKYSEPDTEVVVKIARRGDEAEVAVRDRGRGILPHHLPRLFDRYYREERAGPRHEGLGLGLYITKGMVEANGGRVWVESEAGVGSTFTFTLPLA